MVVSVWLKRRRKTMGWFSWQLLWGAGLLTIAMSSTSLANELRASESLERFGCRNCVIPEYPEAALNDEIEGAPVVEFKVNRYGDVIYARVVRSSGNADLDWAGLAALIRSKFTANSPEGTHTIKIDFSIEGSARHQRAVAHGERRFILPAPTEDSTQSSVDDLSPTVQPVQSRERERTFRLSLDDLESTLKNTIVNFEVDRNGQVVDASIAQSSGHVSLDRDVLQTVRRTNWTLGSHIRLRTLEAGLPFYLAPEPPIVEGQPRVEVEVDANGNVIDARLVESSGDAALDQAALDAVLNYNFTESNL
ncbi:MAG: TonB family protein [Cyanobacteria bacterium P01_F01_bin.86]